MNTKKIKKVTIEPGCTSCGLCEFVAPAVFQVTDISHVNQTVDPEEHKQDVRIAAKECPVSVIKIIEM